MKKVKIGDLRQRILFQKENKADDGAHGYVVTWDDVAEVWAKVEPVSGTESYFAHQLRNVLSHKIKIRYWSDISVEMRVVFKTRIMKIESIIDIEEKRRFMVIGCVEEEKKE